MQRPVEALTTDDRALLAKARMVEWKPKELDNRNNPFSNTCIPKISKIHLKPIFRLGYQWSYVRILFGWKVPCQKEFEHQNHLVHRGSHDPI
jgi:hypothetical protein